MELLIFYYIFSVLFMVGYADFDDISGIGDAIFIILAIIISAPILLPINIGYAIHELSK